MNKKKIITLSIVALAFLCVVGVVYAYFTTNDTNKNVFTTGKIKIDLTETKWDDTKSGKGLVPGNVVEKDPTISGIDGESYARIIVKILDEKNNLITDEERLNLIKQTIYYDKDNSIYLDRQYSIESIDTLLASGSIKNLYNNSNFNIDSKRSTDNTLVFNYSGTLGEGQKATLFTHLIIPTDWTNEEIDKIGNFKLEISAEAIQTTGFETAEDAFTQLDQEV